MAIKYIFIIPAILLLTLIFLQACDGKQKKASAMLFQYKSFKDSISKVKYDTTGDANNIFDENIFTPGRDTLETLLKHIDTVWKKESLLIQQIDTLIKMMKPGDEITPEQRTAIKDNLLILDSFLKYRTDTIPTHCREKNCFLYAEIIKSSQTMYLYVDGQLEDSFKVSTGISKYETPSLSLHPSGPLFTKYNSRKFPGGNYQGLGNMPYAVFIRGGYAIHGTTPGNFSKLGTKASHGCIRLHPYNARIFYELVKRIGPGNTWVRLKETQE